jgi:O-antigen/teichoic acid export membrane protein
MAEVVIHYAWAVATVAAGAGVWGFASAGIVRSVVGTVLMIRMAPLGFVRPRWSWSEVRPLLGFGVRFQASPLVDICRDQTLNFGIAAIAGVATLGVWSLAYRIAQVPISLMVNLYRVSYPAMAQLLAAGQDPRPSMERAAALTATAMGIASVGIVAGSPALVPAVLGDRWDHVSVALVALVGGLLIGGPIVTGAIGWLYATGQPGVVLRASVYGAVTLLAIALGLLPLLGVGAVGLGWFAANLVNRYLVSRAAHRGTGARFWRSVASPLTLSFAAGATGWAISTVGDSVAAGIAGALVAEGLLVGGLALVSPELLAACRRLVRQGLTEARTVPA